jgi:hypothetical protein
MSIEKLLEDEPISYYWMGFLLADGHFNAEKGFIAISLDGQDLNHLKKLHHFLNCSTKIRDCKGTNLKVFSIYKKTVVSQICQKFNISNRKTYNPPDFFPKMSEDLYLSMLAGFIDGDGCIKNQTNRKDVILMIKIHSSWLGWLAELGERVTSQLGFSVPMPKINNAGYTSWFISNNLFIRKMKKEVLRLGLPVLLRKWDKINLDQISNREIEGLVLELHQKGVSRKEIASRLKINLDSLSKIFTRNGFYLRNIKNKKVGKWCDLNKNNPENNKDLITD